MTSFNHAGFCIDKVFSPNFICNLDLKNHVIIKLNI